MADILHLKKTESDAQSRRVCISDVAAAKDLGTNFLAIFIHHFSLLIWTLFRRPWHANSEPLTTRLVVGPFLEK
ncbi:hypothetical protein RF819_20195 [Rhodoferax fermentans]|uniref:Uncharacterized protein n=1 Tax=Rhodoferax fermentans TaxID=28066 RepID=A0A1T1AX49_RHOFE|nr:hypothetical protein RF819_20195 [Rhodoferax fermentans]